MWCRARQYRDVMYYMTSFKANLSQIEAGPPDLERLISLLAEPRGHTIISWGQSGSQDLRISGSLSSRLAVRISGSLSSRTGWCSRCWHLQKHFSCYVTDKIFPFKDRWLRPYAYILKILSQSKYLHIDECCMWNDCQGMEYFLFSISRTKWYLPYCHLMFDW